MSCSEKTFRAVCRDPVCGEFVYFVRGQQDVYCFKCGQNCPTDELVPIDNNDGHPYTAFLDFKLKRILPNRPLDRIKVFGLSDFHCKLISPLMTRFGMDQDGNPIQLSDATFSYKSLSNRAFRIEPQHLNMRGFGRDITGSHIYLYETLKRLTAANGNEERLVPIHVDGDGHCLVHAVSRALVGRELFWHPLRCSLKKHLQDNLQTYKAHLSDFIFNEEWPTIIAECDPDFKPPDCEYLGLRNVHIFGLANLLRRPIILIDSYECMQKSGDYSAVFLPAFVDVEDCTHDEASMDETFNESVLNHPIVIAWSSKGHNHYIPLVGIKGRTIPVFPRSLLPTVWGGFSQTLITKYITFENDCCIIGGGKCLNEKYLHRVVQCMNKIYFEEMHFHPILISEAKVYMCSDNTFVGGVNAIEKLLRKHLDNNTLFRCIVCQILCKKDLDFETISRTLGSNFKRFLYDARLYKPGIVYNTPIPGLTCTLNRQTGQVQFSFNDLLLETCTICAGQTLRVVKSDGKAELKIDDWQRGFKSISLYDDLDLDLKSSDCRIDFTFHAQTNQDVVMADPENVTCDIIQNDSCEDNKIKSSNDKIESSTVNEDQSASDKSTEHSETATTETIPPQQENVSEIHTEENAEPLIAVKIASSNGKNVIINISPEGIVFSELQKLIAEKLSIPISNQRLRMGHPSKLMDMPPDEIVLLTDGDKIDVDNCLHCSSISVDLLNKSVAETKIEKANRFFEEGLETLRKRPASTERDDFIWQLMKTFNSVFLKGGFIYIGIVTGRSKFEEHLSLPYLPTKTFFYRATCDHIKVCIKNIGHFKISDDVDNRVRMAKAWPFNLDGISECHIYKRDIEDHIRLGPGTSSMTSQFSFSCNGPKRTKRNEHEGYKRNLPHSSSRHRSDIFKTNLPYHRNRGSNSEESDDGDYDSM